MDNEIRVKDLADTLIKTKPIFEIAEELAKRLIEEEEYNNNKIVISDKQQDLIYELINKICRTKYEGRGRKPKNAGNEIEDENILI